jgi:hypothetical protein
VQRRKSKVPTNKITKDITVTATEAIAIIIYREFFPRIGGIITTMQIIARITLSTAPGIMIVKTNADVS